MPKTVWNLDHDESAFSSFWMSGLHSTPFSYVHDVINGCSLPVLWWQDLFLRRFLQNLPLRSFLWPSIFLWQCDLQIQSNKTFYTCNFTVLKLPKWLEFKSNPNKYFTLVTMKAINNLKLKLDSGKIPKCSCVKIFNGKFLSKCRVKKIYYSPIFCINFF